MRQRLRELPSVDELDRMYATPHDHHRWVDHELRVKVTSDVARWAVACFLGDPSELSGADLSCGNGHILSRLAAEPAYYGDFAPGYEFFGPIEKTIREIPQVDVFINTETLEHVDDPQALLAGIREKCKMLILSTPVDALSDNNPEHLWCWDRAGVEEMLAEAGFDVATYVAVDLRPSFYYCFGIWVALCQ